MFHNFDCLQSSYNCGLKISIKGRALHLLHRSTLINWSLSSREWARLNCFTLPRKWVWMSLSEISVTSSPQKYSLKRNKTLQIQTHRKTFSFFFFFFLQFYLYFIWSSFITAAGAKVSIICSSPQLSLYSTLIFSCSFCHRFDCSCAVFW